MKLILCLKCTDVVRLIVKEERRCKCNESWGLYTDEVSAMVGGPCVVLGIANGSLADAVRAKPRADGLGNEFNAFVIPPGCPSVSRVYR